MQQRRFFKRCIYCEVDSVGSFNPIESAMLLQEEWCYVTEAFHSLQERQQKIIIEYYYNNRTLSSIAKDMGISVSYASRYLKRCVKELKELVASMSGL